MRYLHGFVIILALWCLPGIQAAEPTAKPDFEDIPKIDIHVHFFEDVPGLGEKLKSINMQVISICTRGNNPEYLRLMQEVSERLHRQNPGVFHYASTFDLTERNKAGYHQKVRNFFIRYQDRILYGTDIVRAPARDGALSSDRQQAWLEQIDKTWQTDYQFYAGSGTMQYGGRDVQCLDLPVGVLEKFYAANAGRIIPGLQAKQP